MAPEIDSDERTSFEQQLLALAKENDVQSNTTPLKDDGNEQVDSSQGNVEDMVQDLLGALKREKKNMNEGLKSSTDSSSAFGPIDDDFAKLLGALDDALDCPEETQVEPRNSLSPNGSAPSLGSAGYADTRTLEFVTASSRPGDADLVKLLGDLGNALNKPEENKALAQVLPVDSPKKTTQAEPWMASPCRSDANIAKFSEDLGKESSKPEEPKALAQVLVVDNSTKQSKVEPATASKGPSNADIEKLARALGTALNKPEEQKTLTQVQAKQSSNGSIQVESVTLSSSPGEHDLAKLAGALGNALNKPEEHKAISQVQSGKDPQESTQIEPVRAEHGPTDDDLTKLMGALSKALKNPNETKS